MWAGGWADREEAGVRYERGGAEKGGRGGAVSKPAPATPHLLPLSDSGPGKNLSSPQNVPFPAYANPKRSLHFEKSRVLKKFSFLQFVAFVLNLIP